MNVMEIYHCCCFIYLFSLNTYLFFSIQLLYNNNNILLYLITCILFNYTVL